MNTATGLQQIARWLDEHRHIEPGTCGGPGERTQNPSRRQNGEMTAKPSATACVSRLWRAVKHTLLRFRVALKNLFPALAAWLFLVGVFSLFLPALASGS